MEQKTAKPPIWLNFTDGGTDQRNTLESVKFATICLFKEFNLDMIILGRCARGHSYINLAERVMSILNLGLQNVSLQRKAVDDASENLLKKCGSMASLRELGDKKPEIKQVWFESVEQVQSLVRNQFLRLSLKGQPFSALDPVPDQDIDNLKRHLRELFPDLDLTKLNKNNTSKCASYQAWISVHCRARQYTFQVRKSADQTCCLPPSVDIGLLSWLPDPVLDETGEHYKQYSEAKNFDTDEIDRPSLKQKKSKNDDKSKAGVPKQVEQVEQVEQTRVTEILDPPIPQPDSQLCTTQNVRAVVTCIECRKPRVIYSHLKLSERQSTSVALSLTEYEYTCGAPLLPPTNNLHKKVMTRSNITCGNPVELQYYGSELGSKDICCFCTAEGCQVNAELKTQYKTVLPVCDTCLEEGKTPIVQRPFGQKKSLTVSEKKLVQFKLE